MPTQSNINHINELTSIIDKKADDDEAQTAIGVILLWSVLFAQEDGDGEEVAECS